MWLLTPSLKRVAWWFTSEHDDVTCDHGSPEMQLEEDGGYPRFEEENVEEYYDLIEIK